MSLVSIALVIVAVALNSAVVAGLSVSIVGQSGLIPLVRGFLAAIVLTLSTTLAYSLTCSISFTSQFWFNLTCPQFIRGDVRRKIAYRTLIGIPVIGITVVGFISTTIALAAAFGSPQERHGHILTYLQFGFKFCQEDVVALALITIVLAIYFAVLRSCAPKIW